MPIFHAVILGVVQGLTEFIPVSSSGHLIAVPALLGWSIQSLSFDVSAHMGTLIAVIAYFRRDWARMLSGFARHILRGVKYEATAPLEENGRLLVPMLVACVPAAVVGFLWEDFIEQTLREWYWVAAALVLVGLVMLAAERVGRKRREISDMGYFDFILIGCAQAMALFPGVSRSGITISAGLFRNLDRAAAARFSFLFSTPIIFGAGMMALKDLAQNGLPAQEAAAFGAGFVAAAVSGYVAIGFLMRYLQSRTLDAFVVYRFALALLLVLVAR